MQPDQEGGGGSFVKHQESQETRLTDTLEGAERVGQQTQKRKRRDERAKWTYETELGEVTQAEPTMVLATHVYGAVSEDIQ